jgi:hypothetical protein
MAEINFLKSDPARAVRLKMRGSKNCEMHELGNLSQPVAVMINPADMAGVMPAYATATDDTYRSDALSTA